MMTGWRSSPYYFNLQHSNLQATRLLRYFNNSQHSRLNSTLNQRPTILWMVCANFLTNSCLIQTLPHISMKHWGEQERRTGTPCKKSQAKPSLLGRKPLSFGTFFGLDAAGQRWRWNICCSENDFQSAVKSYFLTVINQPRVVPYFKKEKPSP